MQISDIDSIRVQTHRDIKNLEEQRNNRKSKSVKSLALPLVLFCKHLLKERGK